MALLDRHDSPELSQVRLNSGGYDHLGNYFGIGEALYECFNDDLDHHYIRAYDRPRAIALLQMKFKNEKIKLLRGGN